MKGQKQVQGQKLLAFLFLKSDESSWKTVLEDDQPWYDGLLL